ncbi:MAG TPA: S24 family peptidase [Sphingobium sp.]|uniref:S24 family peptidase n=1 Tax=Sphingobium sp. TaxID=1912891 RepID=UPI002ED04E3A
MNANSNFANVDAMPAESSDKDFIQRLIAFTGLSASETAARAGLAVSTLTRPLNQPVKYKLSKATIDKLKEKYPGFPDWAQVADLPDIMPQSDYVSVEVLPTYAGMGGGGSGDGDQETALISRVLIEDMLRGRGRDFVIINVRGDSMEPDFRHGDQLLVDRRDTSPAQPGPFAIWDGEWSEYVVKNVERLTEGRVRMFSTNPKYSASEVVHDQTRILGRPVWFGRRL